MAAPFAQKEQILEEIFKNLIPKKDFHFLGLSADILDSINFIEDKSKIIVAIFNEKSKVFGLLDAIYFSSAN